MSSDSQPVHHERQIIKVVGPVIDKRENYELPSDIDRSHQVRLYITLYRQYLILLIRADCEWVLWGLNVNKMILLQIKNKNTVEDCKIKNYQI